MATMSENDISPTRAGEAAGSAAALTVSFGYSAAEDRIIGVVAQGETRATVMLTRRLVRRTIARLAELLDRSSPMAGRAPAAMRAEVVQIEHQSAVSTLARGSGAVAAKAMGEAASRSPRLLVTQVSLTPQPPGFVLVLAGAGGRKVTLRLKWQDLHRIVGALHQQARDAQWDLADTVPWLAPPETTSPASA